MGKTRQRSSGQHAILRPAVLLDPAKSLDVGDAAMIAEQRRGKQRESESEDRYRIVVETASEGIWTIEEKNLTTLANRALAEMLGYEPQEMLGTSMFEFMDPADAEEARRSLRLGREGVIEQRELQLLAKDGRE